MRVLKRRALCVEQAKTGPLFLFTLRAEEVLEVAEIARVNRDRGSQLIGYQRAEVRRHVDDIVDYLNGDDVLFPNAIILALDDTVRFRRSRGPSNEDGLAMAGVLEIPLSASSPGKPAWIVDGQQRALALSRSARHEFPVPVSAFVASGVGQQRDQFLRINNTKPLPRSLVAELLPEVPVPLPRRLAARRVPSELCVLLSTSETSPLRGLIRRSSAPRTGEAVISDTAVVDMLTDSLNSPAGCLFPHRNLATGENDFEPIWEILTAFWGAARDAFPEAWGRPPAESRLMHSVGIRAMGRLMDKTMGPVGADAPSPTAQAELVMQRIQPHCRWTHGTWDELALAWNELENTSRHQRLLANHLIRLYLNAGRP